jgi:hypothetical protein
MLGRNITPPPDKSAKSSVCALSLRATFVENPALGFPNFPPPVGVLDFDGAGSESFSPTLDRSESPACGAFAGIAKICPQCLHFTFFPAMAPGAL